MGNAFSQTRKVCKLANCVKLYGTIQLGLRVILTWLQLTDRIGKVLHVVSQFLQVGLRVDAKICVMGLGYVGLPLALEFAKRYPVVGFDISQQRVQEQVQELKKKKMRVLEKIQDIKFITSYLNLQLKGLVLKM